MKPFLSLAAIAAVSVLSGCSSTYKCNLGNECLNVDDAYGAAVQNTGNKESTMPYANREGKPFDANSEDIDNRNTQLTQSFNPYSGGSMTEKPIYQPPRPLRIWLAPWQQQLDSVTQTEPVLMSGQFLYATVPGYWAMGTLRADGSLSPIMMLEPQKAKPLPAAATPQSQRVQPQQQLMNIPPVGVPTK